MAAPRTKEAVRPPTKCRDCLLRELRLFTSVSSEELAAIERARKTTRLYGPGSHLFLPGDPAREVFTLYSGWAFSYQTLDDGRRQIAAIHLPGDSVGLHPDVEMPRTHGVETLTDVTVCVFDQADLQTLVRQHGRLSLARIVMQEQVLLLEHLTSIGRRTAAERLGFLLLELHTRAARRGLVAKGVCNVPLSQVQLADALGLSGVHVNRMLRELRDRGLLEFVQGRLRILDQARLARMTQFHDRFLGKRPLL